MQLYTTALSHFARKARLLLDLYEIPYEAVDAGNVADTQPEMFAGNPLMKVPTLVDGETWMIESDHIAAYLVRKYDAADRYQVFTTDPADLNIRAVLNGIMTEEVKILLAKRTRVPTENYVFFEKAATSIRQGLEWLETRAGHFTPDSPKYRELHLICLLDHLHYYDHILPLTVPPALESLREKINRYPLIGKTAPQILKPKI